MGFRATEHGAEGASVQRVLEFAAAPECIRRGIRPLPWLIIFRLPKPLETVAVSGTRPELRFFQVQRLCTGVHGTDSQRRQVIDVRRSRNHIRYVIVVPDRLTLSICLALVVVD